MIIVTPWTRNVVVSIRRRVVTRPRAMCVTLQINIVHVYEIQSILQYIIASIHKQGSEREVNTCQEQRRQRTVKAELQRLWGYMWRQGAWEEYHDIFFNLQISHPLLCTTAKASRTKNMHSRRLTSGRCTVVHLAPVNLSSHGSHFLQLVLSLCSTRSMASQRVYNKTIS